MSEQEEIKEVAKKIAAAFAMSPLEVELDFLRLMNALGDADFSISSAVKKIEQEMAQEEE